MATANVEPDLSRLNQESTTMDNRKNYQVLENYNPADYPPVRMRNNNSDRSETQRKRRSKNRLSNRRSTGYISKDAVEEALKMGAGGEDYTSTSSNR